MGLTAGEANPIVFGFEHAIIVVAPVPVFFQMNEDCLPGMQLRCHLQSLFEGIKGRPGDMVGGIPEAMF